MKERFEIVTVNYRPELARQVVAEVLRFSHLSALTTSEWEAVEGGRFFEVSKGLTSRIRHGDNRASIPLSMDSAGWVLARDVLREMQGSRNHYRKHASILDLLVVATTGPKSRLQVGAWSPDGTLNGSSELFVRANQGHSLGSSGKNGSPKTARTSTCSETASRTCGMSQRKAMWTGSCEADSCPEARGPTETQSTCLR